MEQRHWQEVTTRDATGKCARRLCKYTVLPQGKTPTSNLDRRRLQEYALYLRSATRTHAFPLVADVEWVRQFILVVRPNVQSDWKAVGGMHSSACCVQRELANLTSTAVRHDTSNIISSHKTVAVCMTWLNDALNVRDLNNVEYGIRDITCLPLANLTP